MRFPKKQAILEFALYALIILMTALPAIFYKIMSGIAPFVRLNLWVAAPYCGVLIWAFTRLNAVHRKRKAQQAADPTVQAEPLPNTRETQQPPSVAGVAEQSHSILGLTAAQIAVVLLVFTTAIVSFTWALSVWR